MTTPLLPWDAPDDAQHPDIVWRSKLDERYLVEVHRTSILYIGVLHIFDHARNDTQILEKEVALAYGARFGADIDDVIAWQQTVAEFVDNVYAHK